MREREKLLCAVCCEGGWRPPYIGVERWFQGLLGANSTSTALCFAREILARKMGGNRLAPGSTEPGLAHLATAFSWWAGGSLALPWLVGPLDLYCFASILGPFLTMQNHCVPVFM